MPCLSYLGYFAAGVPTGQQKVLQIDKSVQRLNYGVIFKGVNNLVLTNEYWRQTYEIILPGHPPKSDLPADCFILPSRLCGTYMRFIHQIRDLQANTLAEFNHATEFIKHNVPHIHFANRSRKSLLPFVGDLSKNIFGTATMDDVNILKAHINALTKNSRKVANFMKMQTDHFSSFMSTTNKRFDNIQNSVSENFQAISNLSKIISGQIQQAQEGILKLSGIYYSHLAASNKLIKQYTVLKESVNALIEGKLSPALISRSSLEHSISAITKLLSEEYSNFYLTITDPQYFYKNGNYAFGKRHNTLYVTLRFPLSHEKEPLQLFQVISVPVPVNNTSSHASKIQNIPEFLAITPHQQFYLTLDKVDLATCNMHHMYLCSFSKAYVPITSKTCIMSLFANDKPSINELCDFRFHLDVLRPNIIELTEGKVLIYNSYNLVVDCPNQKKNLTFKFEGKFLDFSLA